MQCFSIGSISRAFAWFTIHYRIQKFCWTSIYQKSIPQRSVKRSWFFTSLSISRLTTVNQIPFVFILVQVKRKMSKKKKWNKNRVLYIVLRIIRYFSNDKDEINLIIIISIHLSFTIEIFIIVYEYCMTINGIFVITTTTANKQKEFQANCVLNVKYCQDNLNLQLRYTYICIYQNVFACAIWQLKMHAMCIYENLLRTTFPLSRSIILSY